MCFSFYTPEIIKLIKDNNARVWINALGELDAYIRIHTIGNGYNCTGQPSHLWCQYHPNR